MLIDLQFAEELLNPTPSRRQSLFPQEHSSAVSDRVREGTLFLYHTCNYVIRLLIVRVIKTILAE